MLLRGIKTLTFYGKPPCLHRKLGKTVVVITAVLLFIAGWAFFIQPTQAQTVQILSHRGYLDLVGSFWIFGEFQSDSSSPIYMLHINATYYDSNNNVLDAIEWYAGFPQIVYPGQKCPFLVLESNKTDAGWSTSKIDHYSIEFIGSYVTATVPEVVVVSDKSTTDSIGYMHVTGEVQNTGTTPANYTDVYVTFYDSNGKVVCTDDDYAIANSTAPGEKTPFDVMMVWTDLTPFIASYSVQAQASPTFDYMNQVDDFWQGHSLGQSSGVYEGKITPSPPSPGPNERPNEGNTSLPAAAYTYTAYAPAHPNAVAATAITGVTVGVVSLAVSAVTNPIGQAGRATEKMREILPEGIKKWLEEFFSSKRKSVVNPKTGSPFKPTKPEAAAYVVSLVALTIAFSYVKVPSITLILEVLPTVLLTAVIVELVKTYATEVFARTRGLWAEHRIWYFGLVMFLITTFSFGIPFSSPSRNVYHSPTLTKRLNGMVAAVSVLVTLAFAALFFGLIIGGFTLIGGTGLAMCVIMGFIDTFPVQPLNGKAIFDHSKLLWAGIFAATLAIYVSWLIFI